MRCTIIHYNGHDGSACVGLRSLNVWNGCCVDTERTACTFVLLHMHLNRVVLLAINAVSGCNLKLVYTHYNANAFIFIWSMYETGVVLALNEQYVRFYCLKLTLLPVVDTVLGCRILLISPAYAAQIIRYNGNNGSACVNLCSWNVWNRCRVGAERTASTFVLLRVRLN